MASVVVMDSGRSDSALSARSRLKQLINQKSFSNDREVTLSSGRKSCLYFNMKPTMLDNEASYLIAKEILSIMPEDTDYVGGLEMGAVPIVSALCPVSYIEKKRVQTFFVRKKAKDHGAKKLIEGLTEGQSLKGKNVVVVDDVTTTGNSVVSTFDTLRESGANITMVISIVDREEGAIDLFRKQRIKFISLFKASDFT